LRDTGKIGKKEESGRASSSPDEESEPVLPKQKSFNPNSVLPMFLSQISACLHAALYYIATTKNLTSSVLLCMLKKPTKQTKPTKRG